MGCVSGATSGPTPRRPLSRSLLSGFEVRTEVQSGRTEPVLRGESES